MFGAAEGAGNDLDRDPGEDECDEDQPSAERHAAIVSPARRGISLHQRRDCPLPPLSCRTYRRPMLRTAPHPRLLPAVVLFAALFSCAGRASAATLKVCPSGCPYSQLAPAEAAAQDGDTIKLSPGEYAGGVTIDMSVELVGAGAGATVIRGGGPVLTIGTAGAATEPTVTIDGVTITGGAAIGNLAPESGRGGGIYIPRAAGPSTGATVTIRDSVIRGNRTAPATAVESDEPCCPFADAGGGGVSNDGTLSIVDTTIRDNRADDAGGLASNAIGGGILNRAFGSLTLKRSVVTDNHVAVSPPNGRFAPGGGVAAVGGQLTITDSRVSENTAETLSAVPSGVGQEATAGGIQIQGGASATISRTAVTGNSISSTNTLGDAVAFSGGIHADGPLELRDSVVSHNRVAATTPAGSTGNADATDGGAELNADDTISRSAFVGNTVTATSSAGAAHAGAGGLSTAAFDGMTISDSLVHGNRVLATSRSRAATTQAGGISNIGVLTLRRTSVGHNRGDARGSSGWARGGGIWQGAVSDGPPETRLALVDSAVTRNSLTASPGLSVEGGGLFTPSFPVTLARSVIAGNAPDECSGC